MIVVRQDCDTYALIVIKVRSEAGYDHHAPNFALLLFFVAAFSFRCYTVRSSLLHCPRMVAFPMRYLTEPEPIEEETR